MSAGGTVVIYGGLTFYNVMTKAFDQEIMYDDSGTDALAFIFKIRIAGIISGLPAATTGTLPTTGDFDAANSYLQLQYLFGPRQHFEYHLGAQFDAFGNMTTPGSTVLICDPANIAGNTNVNFLDVNNGPKAKVLSISGVAGQVLRVEVEFEISQLRCNSIGGTSNNWGVLNNRWSVNDSIDKNFFTTRTFTGKLRASSSMVNVNAFRSIVVPPLQMGMRRENMQFAASEDGLNLMYSITDKEVAFSAPAPATTWSARFSEEIQAVGQLGYYSHVDITLGGDRYVDKQKLIALAASMAEAKFQNGVKLANDFSFHVQNIMVVDEYTDDSSLIHFRATALRTDSVGPALLGLKSSFLGVPITGSKIADVTPDYDYRFSRDSRPGDTIELSGPISIAAAFTSYLQSPCNNQYAIANGLQGNPQAGQGAAQSITQVSLVQNNGITDDQSIAFYGPQVSQGMYEYWHFESHDSTESGRVQAPVAATGPSYSQAYPGFPVPPPPNYWDGSTPPPTGTSVVGQIHPPISTKEVTASGSRVGSPPTMPKPVDFIDPNGTQWKVGRVRTSVKNPTPTADAKWVHHVECNILYLAVDALTSGASSSFFGLNPWSIVPTYQVGKSPPSIYQPSTDLNTLTVPYTF